jgi:hypothetical protein
VPQHEGSKVDRVRGHDQGAGEGGRGGGGQQHQQHEHAKPKSLEEQRKELDEKFKKAEEQREMQLEHNKEIDDDYYEKLLAILKLYDNVKTQWDNALAKHEASYEKDKILRNYAAMSKDEKKKYDSGWRRAKSTILRNFLKENDIYGVPTKNDIARQYHVHRKTEKAKQLALDGAPTGPARPHTHKTASADEDVPGGPGEESQFSYDKALWGAQTHTRGRDSLRYL